MDDIYDLLEVRNVSKNYPKFQLKDLSFSIPKGSIVGFIGRNGAGKTTTLKGIMNLIHFDSGEIYFEGKEMREHELEIKQEIGFAMSELNFYTTYPIRKLVQVTARFYKNFDMNLFIELAKRFNLDLNKKIKDLSSGMKVKYNLAIALSHHAKLLILDEPTSGLDPISRDEVLDLFSTIVKSKERSIIFSTHITSDLDKCADRIIYIREGQKVYEGTKTDLLLEYKIIKGDKRYFISSIKNKVESYKENDNDIVALIKTTDIDEEIKSNFSILDPNLEEIMIYHERKTSYEEFDI